jgi:hypothetical protein
MIRKCILAGAAILVLVGLVSWATATDSHAQQEVGGENFIFVNFIGREMSFDLDDVTYLIPGTDTTPEGGKLALQLPVGDHKYAAHIPGIEGSAGEFTITPGQVVAKAARIEQTSPEVKDGILVAAPDDVVLVFDFDPLAGPAQEIPVVDTWQPEVAGPGSTSLVFANFVGDELTLDLNGQRYTVAPPARDIPGRLQLDVSPGLYRYTASVPAGSTNGEIKYDVGEEFELLLPVTMHVFEEDLTARAGVAAESLPAEIAPGTLPDTGGAIDPVDILSPLRPTEGLVVKNFAGDTLLLTINDQVYSIPVDDERTLALPPGRYTYTASIPFVATTGELDLQAAQMVELSIAINVAHDLLSVYQN